MAERKKHVHCYETWPGRAVACKHVPFEQDGEIVHEGVRYRPVLVWLENCLVMAQDPVKAFVATPAPDGGLRTLDDVRELVGAGAGTGLQGA